MNVLFNILFFVSLFGLIAGLSNHSLPFKFLKEKTSRKKFVIIFAFATLIFFVLLMSTITGVMTNDSQTIIKTNNSQIKLQDPQNKNNKNNSSEIENKEIFAVNYEIVKTDINNFKALGNKLLSSYTPEEVKGLPVEKRATYKILVSSDIKENQVRPTVEEIISKITSNDNDIDWIHLLLYSDRDLIEQHYDVAMATWAPTSGITPEIAQSNNRTEYEISLTITENLEEFLKSRSEPEDRFGFSKEKRKQIFKEIMAAENRANKEADELYPVNFTEKNVHKNINKRRELQDLYNLQIIKKYNITDEIRSKIGFEGVVENWPIK